MRGSRDGAVGAHGVPLPRCSIWCTILPCPGLGDGSLGHRAQGSRLEARARLLSLTPPTRRSALHSSLEMRKPRSREVKCIPQEHTARPGGCKSDPAIHPPVTSHAPQLGFWPQSAFYSPWGPLLGGWRDLLGHSPGPWYSAQRGHQALLPLGLTHPCTLRVELNPARVTVSSPGEQQQ